MLAEKIPPYEALATLVTLVRLHCGVGEAMLLQVVPVLEDPVAEVTRPLGPCDIVRSLDVGDKAALPLERPLAELTLDSIDGAVAAHVHPQAALPLADSRADLTDVAVPHLKRYRTYLHLKH